MNIAENKFISLSYKLRLNSSDGEIVETVGKEQPLAFIYGSGNLLPSFESRLKDLNQGEAFSFSLTTEEAYGSIREEAIVDVPLTSFEVNGEMDNDMVQVGKSIPMRDQNGNRMNGAITSINGEYVTMDFNHPLAGRSLFFEGKVLEVREPSEEELNNMAGDSCGCGSGCGCGSDHQEDHAHHTNDASSCGCGGQC